MPFGRRPQEPSPRLLAVLAQSERVRARSEGGDGLQSAERADLSWLPQREDLLPWTDALAQAGLRQPADPQPRADGPAQAGLSQPADPLPRADGPARAGLPGRPQLLPPAGRHRGTRPPGPALFVLPDGLRSARLRVRSPALVGLAAVLALAVLVFGVRVAWARAQSQPTVVAPGAGEPTSALQRGSDPGSDLLPTGATTTMQGGRGRLVVVHVVGQVRRPGVVTLSAGSRVADAIAAAGGATRRADLSVVNLARLLVDGEQIHVPKPGEVVMQAPGATAGSSGGSAGGLVNLNTADLAALDTLPGVGPVLAQRILDWRAEHGRFSRIDELGEVSGIGEKLLAQLRPKVTV